MHLYYSIPLADSQRRYKTMTTIEEVRTALKSRKDRSAWNKGVTVYALELLDNLEEYREYNNSDMIINRATLKTELLNGADTWSQYSYGGSSLIFDYDIAERLCTPSELKRKKGGELNPNSRESWFDVQSRALSRAYNRISDTCFGIERRKAK